MKSELCTQPTSYLLPQLVKNCRRQWDKKSAQARLSALFWCHETVLRWFFLFNRRVHRVALDTPKPQNVNHLSQGQVQCLSAWTNTGFLSVPQLNSNIMNHDLILLLTHQFITASGCKFLCFAIQRNLETSKFAIQHNFPPQALFRYVEGSPVKHTGHREWQLQSVQSWANWVLSQNVWLL